jgi:hypothetical protein
MRYKILTVSAVSGLSTEFGHAADKLSSLVNQAILDGWVPLGGVAVGGTMSMQEPYLFQAMTHP